MKSDNDIFEIVITSGLIGASLGALIKDNKKTATLGAIAGAAIVASYHASEKARNLKVPIIVKENGSLYELQLDGTKKFLKRIPSNPTHLKKEFSLK
jgi:hypothetical protein